jgi:hypothetical protein
MVSFFDITVYWFVLMKCLNYLPNKSIEYKHSSDKDDHPRSFDLLDDFRNFEIQTLLFRRFYLTLLFPEFFKIAIIILYIFDTTSNLLFLLNTLIVSLQWKGIECITRIDYYYERKEILTIKKLLFSFVFAIFCRIGINMLFYSWKDILILGGFT